MISAPGPKFKFPADVPIILLRCLLYKDTTIFKLVFFKSLQPLTVVTKTLMSLVEREHCTIPTLRSDSRWHRSIQATGMGS